MPAETKKCPDCEQEIGTTETSCPKCGCDLELINDETISNFERVVKIVEKRKPKPTPALPVPEPKRKRSLFDSLRKKS